jgi:hypothetical protein
MLASSKCGPLFLRQPNSYCIRRSSQSGHKPSLGRTFRNSVRIPTKPARHSNMKPATRTDLKPAVVPI